MRTALDLDIPSFVFLPVDTKVGHLFGVTLILIVQITDFAGVILSYLLISYLSSPCATCGNLDKLPDCNWKIDVVCLQASTYSSS